MLCEKCGIREAQCVATSCDGIECYERHLCLKCKKSEGVFCTPLEQQQIVESAMEGARSQGLDEESIAQAIGIDAEEIRRILRGEGTSTAAIWQTISRHLIID